MGCILNSMGQKEIALGGMLDSFGRKECKMGRILNSMGQKEISLRGMLNSFGHILNSFE